LATSYRLVQQLFKSQKEKGLKKKGGARQQGREYSIGRGTQKVERLDKISGLKA